MLVTLARSKLIAIILGPVGVGLLGTYEALTTMVMTLSGMGISTSGVRQVALASSTPARATQIVTSINRVAFVFGAIGALVLVATARPISRYTFHDDDHVLQIIALAPSICLVVASCGRIAVIQGLGLISHLARMNLVASVIGTTGSLLIIAWLKTDGIVPAVLFSSVVSYVLARACSKNAKLPRITVTWRTTASDAKVLIQLGLAVMNAAFLSAFVAYIARALISRDIGMQAVGLYVCAYGLSGKFIGVLLDAMRTDFYPRISAASGNHPQLNKVLNEQIEVGLLLSMPGLLATIIFAPWLIRLFYSSSFVDATLLLRVFALGCFVSVVAGPLRMVQLAKGKCVLYAGTETITNGCHVLLVFVLLQQIGLPGASLAYLLHYMIQAALSYSVARRLTGFRFSHEARHAVAGFTSTALGAFAVSLLLAGWKYSVVGGLGMLIVTLYCLRRVTSLLGADHRLARLIAAQPVIGRLIVSV